MGFFKPNKPNVKKMERAKDFEGLIEALNHKDLDVRRKAAGALARLGDAKAVAPLIKVLTDAQLVAGEGFYLLGDVASALGEIGDKRAVKPLKHAIDAEYVGIGGFSSFEDLVSQGAEMNRQINYFKGAAKKALGKIEGKKSPK